MFAHHTSPWDHPLVDDTPTSSCALCSMVAQSLALCVAQSHPVVLKVLVPSLVQTFLPSFRAQDVRDPTATSPAWSQFLLDNPF